MRMRAVLLSSGLALSALVASGLASAVHAQSSAVSYVLNIPAGCYPVSFNRSTEEIGTICRGQPNWTPEALQYFNNLQATSLYPTKLNMSRMLITDMEEKVGPGPYLEWYFGEMDKRGLPRPK